MRREITAVTNQLVNSYKRLIVGTEAPAHVSWARNNRALRSFGCRITKAGQGGSSVRIEYRSPDPACNPYLAFSVILAAGLRRPLRGLRATAPRPRPTCSGDDTLRNGPTPTGSRELPAVAGRRHSTSWRDPTWCAEALGDHIFEWFLRNKRSRSGPTTSLRSPRSNCPGTCRTGSQESRGRGRNDENRLMDPLLVYPDPPPPELAQAA